MSSRRAWLTLLAGVTLVFPALAGVVIQTGPRIFVTVEPPPEQETGSVTTPGADDNVSVGANAGYFTIPRTGAADIGADNTDFAVRIWLRPNATDSANNRTAGTFGEGANYQGTERNIFWDSDDQNEQRGFLAGLASGVLYFSVNTTNGAYTLVGTTDLRDGQWHFIVLERDDNVLSIYVDGDREDTVSGPQGNVDYIGSGTNGDPHLHVVGKEKLGVTGGFDGDIGQVEIANVIRCGGATCTVPNAPLEADANTVGLFHFDEGTGTNADDASSLDNDATLRGSPVPSWSTDDPFSALGLPSWIEAANDDAYRMAA
jgi:hypothetical protein